MVGNQSDIDVRDRRDPSLTVPRHKVYVLPYNDFEEFIRKENLQILYRGERTQLTILARSDPSRDPGK